MAGRYIVDFCARSVRLVVEVDGRCHAARPRADKRRDAELCGLGYRVMRVEAALAMADLTAAVALVSRGSRHEPVLFISSHGSLFAGDVRLVHRMLRRELNSL